MTQESYRNTYTTYRNGQQFDVVETIEPFNNGFRSVVIVNGEVWGESESNSTLEQAKWLFEEDYFSEND